MTTFSLLVAAYGTRDYIGEMIDSVRGQTYDDWELVVVDDGSPDDLASEVIARQDDERISLIRLPTNRGVSAARNVGALATTGRYLVIVDSDDVLRADFLERFDRLLAMTPRPAVAGCSYTVIDEAGRALDVPPGPPPLPPGAEAVILYLLETPFDHGPVSVFERATFHAIGGYDEALWFGEDWEIWVRAATRTGADVVVEPEPIYTCRHRVSSVTRAVGREVPNLEAHLDTLETIAGRVELTPVRRRALEAHRSLIRELLDAARYRAALQDRDRKAARQAAVSMVRRRSTPKAWAKLALTLLPEDVGRWVIGDAP